MKRILVAITTMMMTFSASAEYPIYEDDPSGFCEMSHYFQTACKKGDLVRILVNGTNYLNYTIRFCDFTKPIHTIENSDYNEILCIYRGKERKERPPHK